MDKTEVDVERFDDTFFKHGKTTKLMTWLLSRTPTNKKLYCVVSLLSVLFQTVILATDFTSHFELKKYAFPSRRHTLAIMIYHVVTFYLALLATTYSFQSGNKRLGYLSLTAVVLNLCTFVSRCTFEFIMLQFREEQY